MILVTAPRTGTLAPGRNGRTLRSAGKVVQERRGRTAQEKNGRAVRARRGSVS